MDFSPENVKRSKISLRRHNSGNSKAWSLIINTLSSHLIYAYHCFLSDRKLSMTWLARFIDSTTHVYAVTLECDNIDRLSLFNLEPNQPKIARRLTSFESYFICILVGSSKARKWFTCTHRTIHPYDPGETVKVNGIEQLDHFFHQPITKWTHKYRRVFHFQRPYCCSSLNKVIG